MEQLLQFIPAFSFKFFHKTRFMILLITTLCLTFVLSNVVVFNFLILCIRVDSEMDLGNHTLVFGFNSPPITPLKQGWLLSAPGLGSLIGEVILSRSDDTVSFRALFTVYGLITATSTALIPIVSIFSFSVFFGLRILQGLPIALIRRAIDVASSNWILKSQKNQSLTVMYCSLFLAHIYSMPLAAGFLCLRTGWQAVCYILAGSSYLAFLSFYALFRDSLKNYRCVSSQELALILKNNRHSPKQPVPYKCLVRSASSWGILTAYFGFILVVNMIIQFGPTYLHQVLKYDLQKTGIAMAMPPLLALIPSFYMDSLSSFIPYLNAKTKIIIFGLISQGSIAASLLSMAFLSTTVTRYFLFVMIAFWGTFFIGGPIKSARFIAGEHRHVFTSYGFIIHDFTSLVFPVVMATYVPENMPENWSATLVVVAIIVIFCGGVFSFVAEATRQAWAKYGASVYPMEDMT
ncbi:hypothetical protein L596_017739 [Steinernema carpocapsae]|uniref:Major facilitator superfamily (MFS) profile domain-containing protein n=1 Tax=Steinernema carpocapsae TaxID=34508 RepID=A0A4V6A1T2_STECR|nr:hypothetical protein L596_017739 [Steinernema carpocapsae]